MHEFFCKGTAFYEVKARKFNIELQSQVLV